MVINAVCPHCKRVYPVDEQYAGQTFSCKTCGNPFTVPTPGVVRAVPIVPMCETVANGPSRDRRMASRICIALSVLCYVGFACTGCAGVLVLAAPNPGVAVLSVAAAVLALILGTLATTYLICGLRIRKGGHISPIVALVLGGLNGCGSALLLVAGLFQLVLHGGPALGRGPGGVLGSLISLGMHLLFIVGIGQLIYYLIRIMKEPRETP